MTKWRVFGLSLAALAVTAVGAMAMHELAEAGQRPVAVARIHFGFLDNRGRFVPTAGRGATNVDRNALIMFVFTGQVDMGPNLQATLPLTLGEQAELNDLGPRVADGTATAAERRRFAELGGDLSVGFEPGVLGRRDSSLRDARFVATGSINTASVHIAVPTVSGETLATGQFFKLPRRGRRGGKKGTARRKLIFNPRFAAATFNRPEEIDYNPQGYLPNTTYVITMDGGPDAANPFELVTNRDGAPLARPFIDTFITSDRYVQDFTRPEIRDISPTDGAVNVASDADIDISFSEPMSLDSFRLPAFQLDDTWTTRVRYTQNAGLNGSLAGRNVLGIIRAKPQTAGDVIQFRPLQGFGTGPYEIEVTVSAAITDLSGNNITRQQQIVFTTQFDPEAENFDFLEEDFETDDQEDKTFVPSGDNLVADWNTSGDPGFLSTQVAGVTFDSEGPNAVHGAGFGVNVWNVAATKMQFLFPAADMGGRARTLTGFDWYSGVFVGQTYPSTVMQLGHATDSVAGGGFSGAGPVATNFRSAPTLLYPTAPYSTVLGTGTLVKGPTFATNFNSDGQNAVIIEITHGGHGATTDERWTIDSTFSINTLTVTIVGGTPSAFPWYGSTQWTYLSPGAEAQSLWYDVGIGNARYLPQQIVPAQQLQGTSISFQWQGAMSDVADPTLRDPTTETEFLPDVRQLANHRFLRFRVTLLNNLVTLAASRIDNATVPFTFR